MKISIEWDPHGESEDSAHELKQIAHIRDAYQLIHTLALEIRSVRKHALLATDDEAQRWDRIWDLLWETELPEELIL